MIRKIHLCWTATRFFRLLLFLESFYQMDEKKRSKLNDDDALTEGNVTANNRVNLWWHSQITLKTPEAQGPSIKRGQAIMDKQRTENENIFFHWRRSESERTMDYNNIRRIREVVNKIFINGRNLLIKDNNLTDVIDTMLQGLSSTYIQSLRKDNRMWLVICARAHAVVIVRNIINTCSVTPKLTSSLCYT